MNGHLFLTNKTNKNKPPEKIRGFNLFIINNLINEVRGYRRFGDQLP